MDVHTEGAGMAVAKLAPPLTVGGMTLFGVPLSEVVLILTGIYAVLQIGFLLHDRIIKPKRQKKGKEDGRQRSNLKQDT